MRTVLAVAAFAFLTVPAVAQPAAPPAPAPLPPGQAVPKLVSVPAREPVAAPTGLPGGTEVSQPLQPVGPAVADPPQPAPQPAPAAVSDVKTIPPEPARGPLGPTWDNLELLYWWPTRQPIPALAYGTHNSLASLTGTSGLPVLAGGRAISSQPSAGGRFTLGSSLNSAQTFGAEVTYFFLGTRTFQENVRNFAGSPIQSFGVPYVDEATGVSQILPLGQAGVTQSNLNLLTSVRVQGWEVNTVANFLDTQNTKLNFLLGWRYFQAQEGLRLEQSQFRPLSPGSIIQTADQFDAHNRFNGGQLGLNADMRRGIVFCELTAKIAFGQTYEVVKTEGQTNFITPVLGGSGVQSYGGSGIYVQPSNFGRAAHGVFAVLPEGTIKFGFRLGETGRVYVGYSFLYLSDAVRPGDQIDRTLNPSQIPLVSGAPPVYTADRPLRLFNHSDFWVQGLVIGLETRY